MNIPHPFLHTNTQRTCKLAPTRTPRNLQQEKLLTLWSFDHQASLEAHHSNSPFLAVFRACANEIIPPSRTFVYTGCSVILRAVSRMAVEEVIDPGTLMLLTILII
jgi:hypothetical protein